MKKLRTNGNVGPANAFLAWFSLDAHVWKVDKGGEEEERSRRAREGSSQAWTCVDQILILFSFGEPQQSDHFGLGRGNQRLKTCKESTRNPSEFETSIIEWVCEVRDKKTLHGSIGYEGITVNKK